MVSESSTWGMYVAMSMGHPMVKPGHQGVLASGAKRGMGGRQNGLNGEK